MTTLAAFLLSIVGSLAGRVLLSLGIGVVSYAALSTLATNVVSTSQANYAVIDSRVLQLINLGGIGEFLGIVSGALISKATLSAIKRLRPL